LEDTIIARGGQIAEDAEYIALSKQVKELYVATRDIETGLGRALNAQKIKLPDLGPTQVSTILKAADGDPAKITQILNLIKDKGNASERIVSCIVNGLLSSPVTHAGNAVSNAVQMLLQPTQAALGATLAGDPRNGFGLTKGAVRRHMSAKVWSWLNYAMLAECRVYACGGSVLYNTRTV
jgi:hypothetical protein